MKPRFFGNFFNRRKLFQNSACFFLLSFFCPFRKIIAFASDNLNLERFNGELLKYKLSFLWFDQIAAGHIHFLKTEKGFLGKMTGETKGMIGWLTSYRKHTYISHMERHSNGYRSVLFEREVIVKDKVDKSLNYFDYEKRIFSWKVYKNGKLIEEDKKNIPENITYEDILSAFYNFRIGSYGEIVKGKEYIIDTLPSEGISKFHIRVAPWKEEQLMRKKFGKESQSGYLVYVKIPPAIFNSKKGEVVIWFNNDLIPTEGTIEDAVGFGDIIGILDERIIDIS